jgi:hypothetical protein
VGIAISAFNSGQVRILLDFLMMEASFEEIWVPMWASDSCCLIVDSRSGNFRMAFRNGRPLACPYKIARYVSTAIDGLRVAIARHSHSIVSWHRK